MRAHSAAISATNAAAADLGAMPEWNLADLYPAMDAPQIKADLAKAAAEAKRMRERYQGKLTGMGADGAGLAEAIVAYEVLSDLMGRLGSYAGLLYAGNQADPARAKFYGDTSEQLTNISAELIFFELELNQIDDAALASALEVPALARYKPWLDDLRKEKPHQLEEKLEKLFHEKGQTSRGAFNRLFDETMTGLRFKVAGHDEPLTIEPTLNMLTSADRAKRQAGAEALAVTFKDNIRLFTLITNTLAKDKEISDRWRSFKDIADARHLSNKVEGPVVEALVDAVRAAYPRLSHRYYAMKAKWLGLDRLAHWDRNAPLPEKPERIIPWAEAETMVLDAYRGFAPEMAGIAGEFFAKRWIDAPTRPGKSPGAFAHPTVPSAHPYVLLNYQGKSRDVMTLAHELGHGVHQVLAAKQGPLLSQTPLTLAETASVFGEMLTFKALLAGAKDARERKALLAGKVEDMLNTVVRQIAFYTFRAQDPHRAPRRRADQRPDQRAVDEHPGREPRAGDRLQARLRGVLDLHPALHPFAVLRLRLRVRRLPGEFALWSLQRGAPGLRGEVLRHAESRRLEAPFRAARPVRPRRVEAGVLGQGPQGDRGHDRRVGADVTGGAYRHGSQAR